MEGKYPIMIDDALAGTLEVTKKGAMTVFDARCRGTDALLRLSVYGDDGEGYLGVMVPEDGEMRLRRSMSPLSMKGFPEEIVAAGPAGRGNAGQQGKAEKDAAPQTGGGETMAGRVEKPETMPPEKMAEESCDTAPCEAGCGGAASPAPPEACGKPKSEEVDPPCEKPSEQETESPCEKCPEQEAESPCEKCSGQEAEPPCEKCPGQEAEPPCEKCPEQEAESPCEKYMERQEEEPPCDMSPEAEMSHSGQNTPAAPSRSEDSPDDMEDLCWYASPDGALVCFDGVHSLIALPPADERVPINIPGQPRQIEGRDYLVYVTKNGRIVS